MTIDELTCRELVELVTDYLEGTLVPSDRARFEEHLGICSGCREYLDQMRLTIKSLGHLTEDHISPRAREDLLSAFRSWKQA